MARLARATVPRERWIEIVAFASALAFLGLFVAQWTQFLLAGGASNIGVDFALYHDATASWLSGHGFYLAHQIAGPYVVSHGDVLYPPPILVLLVPFQVLPALLWWVIPIGVTTALVLWHRPSPIAWLVIALCLWYPVTGVRIWHGNPGLWMTAAIALGTRLTWPSVFVLLKPTLLPFALVGVHRRAWWLGLAGLALVSLVFLPMWADFIAAIRNARTDAGLLYSLDEVPQQLIPVVAWIGGRRRMGG